MNPQIATGFALLAILFVFGKPSNLCRATYILSVGLLTWGIL